MKFFEGAPKGAWGNRYNWVDDNDVFVGFDAEQC
jgi:hypothetical protein